MSIERDIATHGTGVLAWCAWNERRQRPFIELDHTGRPVDQKWRNASFWYTVTGPSGDSHHYQPHVGPM